MPLSQKGFSSSKLLLGLLAILILSVLFFRVEIQRIYHGLTLFDKANIVENMRNSNQHYTSSNVEAAKQTWQLNKGEPLSLPETFNYYGEAINTADYINYTHTGSLLVMQHGDLRYENYFRGETENDPPYFFFCR